MLPIYDLLVSTMSTNLIDEMEIESYELCIRILESERRRIVYRGQMTPKERARLGEIEIEIQTYENLLDRFHGQCEKKLNVC